MSPLLPIELCYSIIQHIDDIEDLLILSLCYSDFRKEAQRLLFRHPDVHNHQDLMLFILAICTDSLRLGPLVHIFSMEYSAGPDTTVTQDTAFIAYALSSMCNLKQVEHHASPLMPLKIYENCKAQLESFSYYGDLKATSDISMISSLIHDVLPNQPSLTHIIINCSGKIRVSSELMKAAADLCPNLMSLSVNIAAVGKMLLQRKKNLQSLQWIVGTSTPRSMKISQYNNLSYLMLMILDRDLNTSFAQHLSSLTLLELCFSPRWDEDVLMSELQFVAQITCLQYLILHIGIPAILESLEDGQQMECPEVARGAFRLRNSLMHIDIGSIREPSGTYLRVFAPLHKGSILRSRIMSGREVDAFRIKYSLR